MAPYLTVTEYKSAPTAVDLSALVPGGDQAAQDAALAEVINEASGWIDTECDQPLIASLYSDVQRVRYQRDGTLSIHPRRAPLNQLVGISIGWNATNLSAMADITGAYIDVEQWIVPGPISLGLGLGGSAGGRVLASLSVVSGWPNTTLASAAAQGAVVLQVASGVGFRPALGSVVADQTVTIYDGPKTETIVVAGTVGNVLTCSATQYQHDAGAVVSMLPADIKKAGILVVSAFVRDRGGEAGVMGQQAQPGTIGIDPLSSTWLGRALRMLAPYSRVR